MDFINYLYSIRGKITSFQILQITIVVEKTLFPKFSKVFNRRLGKNFSEALSVRLNQEIKTYGSPLINIERLRFVLRYNANIGYSSVMESLSNKNDITELVNAFNSLLPVNSFKPLNLSDSEIDQSKSIKVTTCFSVKKINQTEPGYVEAPPFYIIEHLDNNLIKHLWGIPKSIGISLNDENLYNRRILGIYRLLPSHNIFPGDITRIGNMTSFIEAIFPKISGFVKEKLEITSSNRYLFIKTSDIYVKEKTIEYLLKQFNKPFSIKPYFDLEDERLKDFILIEDFGKLPPKQQSKYWKRFKLKQFQSGFVVFFGEALPTVDSINQEINSDSIFTLDKKRILNNISGIIYSIIKDKQNSEINYLTAYHIFRNFYNRLFIPRYKLLHPGFINKPNIIGILKKAIDKTCDKTIFEFNSSRSWYLFFQVFNSELKHSSLLDTTDPVEVRYISFEFYKNNKTWTIYNLYDDPINALPSSTTILLTVLTIMYYNKNHKAINYTTLYDYYRKYAPEYRSTRKNKSEDKSKPNQIISTAYSSKSQNNLNSYFCDFLNTNIKREIGQMSFVPISKEKHIEYRCEFLGIEFDKETFSTKYEPIQPAKKTIISPS